MKKKILRIFAVLLAAVLLTAVPANAVPLSIIEGLNGDTDRGQQETTGSGDETVTILVYMNGSNLESESGAATKDLREMVRAGGSSNVNLLVETLGTAEWSDDYDISADCTQIHKIDDSGVTLVRDDMGQLDCTDPDTLADFIRWSAQNYPADRYILLLWDHGGGPVYGVGYDEWIDDNYAALTLDEMQTALTEGGVYFDFIGMDCCLMASLEVCCALYSFCDYMVLAEDFESGYGWYYTDWLETLYADTSIPTADLGKIIVDGMISYDNRINVTGILSVVDESAMQILYAAWKDFAYANEDALLGSNYSQQITDLVNGRVLPRLLHRDLWGLVDNLFGMSEDDNDSYSNSSYDFFSDWSEDDVTLADYYVTDIMAVAQTIDSDESQALSSAVSQAIVYMNATESDASMTGLSVTLPYGDSAFYSELKSVFSNAGFEDEYIEWLGQFAGSSGSGFFHDYGDFQDEWSGWDDYQDDFDWSDWDYGDEDYWSEDDWGWDDFFYDDNSGDYYYDDDYYDDYDYYDYFFGNYDNGGDHHSEDHYCDDSYYDDYCFDDYDDDDFYDDYYDDDYYYDHYFEDEDGYDDYYADDYFYEDW